MEVRLLKLWETVITPKSPIHEAKFPTAVNAKNDDECDLLLPSADQHRFPPFYENRSEFSQINKFFMKKKNLSKVKSGQYPD